MDAIMRLFVARKLCLAPHVCEAMYHGDPLPIGWEYQR